MLKAMFKIKTLTLFIFVISVISSSVNANSAPEVFTYHVKKQDDLVILSNGKSVEVAISPEHGGELSSFSIKHLDQWHELIYHAKDYQTGKNKTKGWRGKAWFLWPATGPSKIDNITVKAKKMGHYKFNDSILPMPMHGFAKDMSWEVVKTNNTDGASVTLAIHNTADTLQYYPFGFTLSVTYQLKNEQLNISYLIKADKNNKTPMPFSIGNHMTFNAPLIKRSQLTDFSFTTTSDLQLERIKGMPTGKTLPSPYINPISLAQLPEKKSVSLLNSDARKNASLTMTDASGISLNISHRASTLPKKLYLDFNLWASAKEKFFSPEPWIGAQNALNSGFGLTTVKPNEQWQWHINLSLLR